MEPANFYRPILAWYDQHGRHDLPWQKRQTPYRVWISEVMLQQTQVATVIPYYQRFMRSFPSIKSLAQADTDAVLQHWSGLGYYARARNLHQCAQLLHDQYHGRFPDNVDEIATLPGIGLSTAGAIVSLSRNKHAVILDGNVRRVLTRVFVLEGVISSNQFLKKLWELARELTPPKRCRDYTQAMMDLGALVCTRSKPNCVACPLNTVCEAKRMGSQALFPSKKQQVQQRQNKQVFMLLIENKQGEVLLEKRPASGIWGGLWSLPECHDLDNIALICKKYGCHVLGSVMLPQFKHVFSHFDLLITPVRVSVAEKLLVMDSTRQVWYKSGGVLPGGISAAVDKLIHPSDEGVAV